MHFLRLDQANFSYREYLRCNRLEPGFSARFNTANNP